MLKPELSAQKRKTKHHYNMNFYFIF